MVKRLSTMRETWVRSLGRKDPLEKEMAIHSSTIAWKIPWTEEPGRLQSMGSQRVGPDWATSLSLSEFITSTFTSSCICELCVCMLSHVQLFVTLWTVACQAPCSWNSPGNNTGVGCHALLQGIFLTPRIFMTQGPNQCVLHFLHCRWILYHWATGN